MNLKIASIFLAAPATASASDVPLYPNADGAPVGTLNAALAAAGRPRVRGSSLAVGNHATPRQRLSTPAPTMAPTPALPTTTSSGADTDVLNGIADGIIKIEQGLAGDRAQAVASTAAVAAIADSVEGLAGDRAQVLAKIEAAEEGITAAAVSDAAAVTEAIDAAAQDIIVANRADAEAAAQAIIVANRADATLSLALRVAGRSATAGTRPVTTLAYPAAAIADPAGTDARTTFVQLGPYFRRCRDAEDQSYAQLLIDSSSPALPAMPGHGDCAVACLTAEGSAPSRLVGFNFSYSTDRCYCAIDSLGGIGPGQGTGEMGTPSGDADAGHCYERRYSLV